MFGASDCVHTLSSMANILSLADKELIVSSFLEIAVGETVETVHHFLQATNWIIEDAMEQFYVGDTTHNVVVSSYIPPIGSTPLLSDHNHSERKEKFLNVNVGRGDGVDTRSSLPVERSDIHYDVAVDGWVVLPIMEFESFAAPPAVFATTISASARPKRRTPAEMDAAGPIEMVATTLLSEVQQLCFVCALPTTRKRQLTSASARPTARRKKRNWDEMATTTLSSEGDHLCFASALSTTIARQQTSVEVTPVFLFGDACTLDATARTTGRRKKRINAEIDDVTQSSTTAFLMPGIIPSHTCQQEPAHSESSPTPSTPCVVFQSCRRYVRFYNISSNGFNTLPAIEAS